MRNALYVSKTGPDFGIQPRTNNGPMPMPGQGAVGDPDFEDAVSGDNDSPDQLMRIRSDFPETWVWLDSSTG